MDYSSFGGERTVRKRHNAGDLEKDREEMLLRREANLRCMFFIIMFPVAELSSYLHQHWQPLYRTE